jgi:hypothetical protein
MAVAALLGGIMPTSAATGPDGFTGPLVTTAMVIAEAAYLIDRQLGAKAEASLYESIINGQIEVAALDIDD